MSEPHHRRRGEHVQDHFLGGAGFQARRPGQDFRTDVRGDGDFSSTGQRSLAVRGDTHSCGAAFASIFESGKNVGRGAACGNSYDYVVFAEASWEEIPASI